MSKQIGVLGGLVSILASIAFVASWSSGFVIAAVATVDVPWTTLLVWRFAPLAVVLLAIGIARGSIRRAPLRDLGRQALIGLFAQFGYCGFVYAAIAAGVATGTTALIDAAQPLVIATLVGPLLGLRVRGLQWVGLVVGAGGVALVVSSQVGGSSAPAHAYLLPAGAMACLVVGTFMDRRRQSPLPVLTTLTVHVSVTAGALTVLAALTGTLLPPSSPTFWSAAALSALVPTMMAYGLYWWLLRRLGITAVNALLFLVAPVTAVSGAVLLGEPLTLATVLAFALCAAGVTAVLITDGRGELRASRRTGPISDPESSRPVARLTASPSRRTRAVAATRNDRL
ncbi:drug/metabolite transporter (DMT)-like permease [Frondihabitans sp. PhB188]|uniref:DMT family transporter n=1 Tax=Frondihabitans sp. PhB188 TaxID=2485200 RepID=UPI000FAB3DF3|nr:DMT family transporter [Frondihabitans sp. PhB188]ROQ40004.1 drug/metabolite transporter (DMT)-like permease [Frondihabitans sp. PhB188]